VFGAIEAFLALYAVALGIPAWQIGVILGAQLVSVVLVKPVMGGLSDRFGRRAVMVPGLLLGAASVGSLPFASGIVSLCLLSVLFGIAFATVTSSTSALVADLSQEGGYGAAIGVLRTVMDVGQTLGPLLTGFLVASYGYGVAFPALALVIAFSILALVAGATPPQTKAGITSLEKSSIERSTRA
jgi:MFS family permease